MTFAQIRSGAAFLKMLPGARLQAMAAGYTAVIDDAYAMYANPGAAGFLREWQWSAAYSKWIAEVYNASFIYGTQLRLPLVKKTNVALGILYQGVPEFDSSEKTAPGTTANDMMVCLNLGQPVPVLARNIALGGNVKYFKSTLDRFDANTWVFDVGILGRTPRFHLNNSVLEYCMVSSGFAVTHMGQDLTFEQEGTPLPRTWRIGTVFYAGSHQGMQLLLLIDYHKIKDEEGAFGFGTEFSWAKRFSLNAGYDLKNDLMSRVSFGVSIRMDDVSFEKSILPGRNNALQFDLATLSEGEFFSNTYRGSLTHYPGGPEYFNIIEPARNDSIFTSTVVMKWQQSRDPDLYDDIVYTVLLTQDSVKLAKVISLSDHDPDTFFDTLADTVVTVIQAYDKDSVEIKNPSGGQHFWSVFALDRDQHTRFAELDRQRIASFYVPLPDIEIQKIDFVHSPWIDTDDYHGDLVLTLTNAGGRIAPDFTVTLIDSIIPPYRYIAESGTTSPQPGVSFNTIRVNGLKPGAIQTIQMPWHTSLSGGHQIVVQADPEQQLIETDETNNELRHKIFTIPKGTFTANDTVTAIIISCVTIDLPLITDISFEVNSAKVRPEYIHKSVFDPPVAIVAERLKANPQLKISLKGFADSNSGETNVALANLRAAAVRDSLLRFGVNLTQVRLLPGTVLPKTYIPDNVQDAKWLAEERRHVEMVADSVAEPVLFQPVRIVDDEELIRPVRFRSQLQCAVPIQDSWLLYFYQNSRDSMSIQDLNFTSDDQGEFPGKIVDNISSPWLKKNVGYHICLTDSLGRRFYTRDQYVYLDQSFFQRENRITVPLKFARTDPPYSFYWDELFEQVQQSLTDPERQISFYGHACAIGPEKINDRLSKQRASRFPQGFMKYVNDRQKNYQSLVNNRIGPAEGFGETRPLCIQRFDGKRILIGDNDTPLGRKLNRRIEISISKSGP